MPERIRHGLIVSAPDEYQCLDAVQLHRLEQSFRDWAGDTARADVRQSRRRILLIFLLIRYTGAKLSEVLALDALRDLDRERHTVLFGESRSGREVHLSEALSLEIQSALADPAFKTSLGNAFRVDPGFVRRKFYERAEALGFPKRLGGPEMIRKSRAIELLQGNMPLPAVQSMLGHSTPSLTTAHVSFSEDDIRQVTKFFMEKESFRRTSARNSFFGKITALRQGDIQTLVELTTHAGQAITTVITNDSLERLGLKKGKLITAEVKAPWVILQKQVKEPASTAENRFPGVVARVNTGRVNTEYVVRMADGTELCSVATTKGGGRLGLREGDAVWAVFNGFAAVLHVD
jgi:molybdate transport system regulatory protein